MLLLYDSTVGKVEVCVVGPDILRRELLHNVFIVLLNKL